MILFFTQENVTRHSLVMGFSGDWYQSQVTETARRALFLIDKESSHLTVRGTNIADTEHTSPGETH